MSKTIIQIRKQLKNKVDSVYRKGFVKYFGGQIKTYGVRTPYVRIIARQSFAEIKDKSKQEIFCLCEELLKSGISEEATIAFGWAGNLKKHYQKTDLKVFEKWLKKYVDNWAKCDDFCTHAFGELVLQFPEFLSYIKKHWTKSQNRWLRRASAVVLIPFVKRSNLGTSTLKYLFEVADLLLLDKDDLVQKGYGWMLKEAANKYQNPVFDFVMTHKDKMPRTALRCAIEKMPQRMRQRAMAK